MEEGAGVVLVVLLDGVEAAGAAAGILLEARVSLKALLILSESAPEVMEVQPTQQVALAKALNSTAIP
jgi:hypothetical protein